MEFQLRYESMTYQHQRKILAYLRENFKFQQGHYYFFDMAKIDIDNSIFEYKEFTSQKAFKLKTRLAREQNLFHILIHPNVDNQMILGVNGDQFDYYENMTTQEIEYDSCPLKDIDPLNLKLEMMQLRRELSSGTEK